MNQPTLIILTDPLFQSGLISAIRQEPDPPDVKLETVENVETLVSALNRAKGSTRLAAFCTGTIVPGSVLRQLTHCAYNFHPGPPEYPGIFPSCFAIYEGASTFGATAHRMTDKIDEGEIVGVQRFPLSGVTNRITLDKLALENTLSLFKQLIPALVDFTSTLAASGDPWTGPARTKKDFKALCTLPEGVTQEEFERAYRAVGEGPDHALTITLFGHLFRLDNHHEDEIVVRGGVPGP